MSNMNHSIPESDVYLLADDTILVMRGKDVETLEDTMPPNKENSGRGRRRAQLTQYEGEKDEDYRLRRERNNEAVRKSRDKSKKKTEETLKRVDVLKMENCMLEAQVRAYREQLSNLKGIFLEHAASGKVSGNIDIDAILRDTDIDGESSVFTTLK